ncbi:PPOX class F420-dependent oxidoreductase [Actinomarinicola tropica]|uniref:TIGR03618 family F420-dependent PPOX class oxidoreductase n=1 Tax=Actinomarinicola tropica TaxID=2789776 RepID=A0A5Q2RHG8_9ACTN|nr:PPOX class F420-dependent oxidoreductase [Actinomarinicola tropica]QGG94312.1 TIGR03618 family F420-dependent PPOX class oxidoreductase [Actinomarinicola tropica]
MTIDADLKNLATAKNFAALTTLSADGQPRTHVMWVDADDEHVLINTEVHRAKFKDIERDPRVTITVINGENPYQYVEVRGRVAETVRGDEARTHIDALSRRYTGNDYGAQIQSERAIVRITPEKLHKNNL